MMRDAVAHGFEVLPPDPIKSDVSWQRTPAGLLAGFEQIPDVGASKALEIIKSRDAGVFKTFDDIQKVKMFGPKTAPKVQDWVAQEDPFGIHTLDKLLAVVKRELPDMGVPLPTHTAQDIPYERGKDEEIVWIGVAVARNLRDIFESNRARSGKELDPSEVQNPELNEFLLMSGYDGSEIVTIRFDRFHYPTWRDMIWNIQLNHDVVLVHGVKKGYRTAREISISRMWVIDPE
jgi:hypothetical protein